MLGVCYGSDMKKFIKPREQIRAKIEERNKMAILESKLKEIETQVQKLPKEKGEIRNG